MSDILYHPGPDGRNSPSGRLLPAGEPILCVAATSEPPATLIRASGEIDMSSAHLLVDMVELIAAHPAPQVALDLSEVTFFGAHGVSALLRARHLVTCAGGVLTLAAVSSTVRRILGVTGVDQLLGVHTPPIRWEVLGPSVAADRTAH
ncbi:anti-sigma B factor antagonist [Micromonospora coriariae]|uniref:Anti-sigma factor antagonist n=2 Tax=Micromonospora coriariae TaxID=285665 RepID=A0A1C4XB87_9ACTN|nr:STAS domain-containing protein [Micromonospora coriariae]SCF05627.1 anti-sigma B factor antagonist [Micromonospora coriariae]